MSFLWSLGAFLVAITVLVFVHEYGHFWAARKCGIQVQRFSIGFGKLLWSRRDKHGTEFALSLIPLGGYVKMLDARNEKVPDHLLSQSFTAKSVWQRAFVIAAGPLTNFLFAVLAYWAVYLAGIPTVKPVIGEIAPQSVAAQARLQPDYQIIAIDGSKTPDWETINMLLATKIGNPRVELTLERFGSSEQLQKSVDLSAWRFDPDKESAFGSLGIIPVRTKIDLTLSKVEAGSPAARAGLKAGDKIVGVDGQDGIDWQDFVSTLQNSEGKALPLRYLRGGQLKDTVLQPVYQQNRWFAGIAPTAEPLPEQYRTELKYGILESLQKGAEKTGQLMWMTVRVIGKLFSGDLSLTNLSGPISIAKGAGVSSEYGWVYYVSFMALISVNLGIMNLFPLPVLDGGHLVFLAAEGIRGRPLSDRVQEITYRIGAVLVLMLMVFALFNDFFRLWLGR